jgi:orotate phosphoribosyltransferase
VVLQAIITKALRQDDSYLLASGRRSNYFLDMKSVLNDGDVLRKIARLILERIPDEASAVGGLAMGAIPISTAVVLLSLEARPAKPLKGFWVRQEEKGHGLGGLVSGNLGPTDRVVIVDDVTTSGKSVIQALDAVIKTGAEVLKVVAIVDRLEGARKELESRGFAFESLFTRKDVLGR